MTSGDPNPPDAALPFERLDFVYMPSRDVASDMRWFTDTLGGRLIFERLSSLRRLAESDSGSPRRACAEW